MTENYKYSKLTGSGATMQLHSELGNGFPEVIYQRSLALELQNKSISYQREESMPLYYKAQNVGSRRADFIEEKDLVELKAVSEINKTSGIKLFDSF